MSSGEREARLNQLREVGSGERGVLTNARCLTEGVDVPTLDGVAFIDPRRSQVDIVQAVGRAMRKADDKTVGTIVIPVFVDENADPEQALDSSEFDRVWQVVKALRAHDEVLADELDELRRERGRRRPARQDDRGRSCSTSPSASGSPSPAPSTRDSSRPRPPVGSSGTDCSSASSPASTTRASPHPHVEGGYRLGYWIANQRAATAQVGSRPSESLRLEALPGWDWNPRDAALGGMGFSRP